MKEMNKRILSLLITSGSQIGVTELRQTVRRAAIELSKRILGSLEPKGEILSNSTSHFHLTAKPYPQCLNLLPLLLVIVPSFLVLAPLPTKRTVPSTSGVVKNEIVISAAPLLVLRRQWLQDGNSILRPMWCVRP